MPKNTHVLQIPDKYKADYENFLAGHSHKSGTPAEIDGAVASLLAIFDNNAKASLESRDIESNRRDSFSIITADTAPENFTTGTSVPDGSNEGISKALREGGIIIFPIDPAKPEELCAISCVKVGEKEYLQVASPDTAVQGLREQAAFFANRGIDPDPAALTLFERICDAFARFFLGRRGEAAARQEAHYSFKAHKATREALLGYMENIREIREDDLSVPKQRESLNSHSNGYTLFQEEQKDRQAVQDEKAAYEKSLEKEKQEKRKETKRRIESAKKHLREEKEASLAEEKRQKEVAALKEELSKEEALLSTAQNYYDKASNTLATHQNFLTKYENEIAEAEKELPIQQKNLLDAEEELAKANGEKDAYEKETERLIREKVGGKQHEYNLNRNELTKLNAKPCLEEDETLEQLYQDQNTYNMSAKDYLTYSSKLRVGAKKAQHELLEKRDKDALGKITDQRTQTEETIRALENQLKVKGLPADHAAELRNSIREENAKLVELKKEEKEKIKSNKEAEKERSKEFKEFSKKEAEQLKKPSEELLSSTEEFLAEGRTKTNSKIKTITERMERRSTLTARNKTLHEEIEDETIAINGDRANKYETEVAPELDKRIFDALAKKNHSSNRVNDLKESLVSLKNKKDLATKEIGKAKSDLDLAKITLTAKQNRVNEVKQKLQALEPKQAQKSGVDLQK